MENSGGDILKQIREAVQFGKMDEYRTDICKFIEYTQVDEMGKPLILGSHHKEWLEMIWEAVRDIVEPGKWGTPEFSNILLFAPRSHGKTTIMAGCLQFFLGKNPRLRIKYVSKNDKLSRDVIGQIEKNIDRNTRLHEVFPNLKSDPAGSWSGSAMDVMKVDVDGNWYEADLGIKDSNLEAYGVSSPATGGRADLIVFDDLIGGREAIHEPGRLDKITKAFYTDWLSIGGKRHIVIGTPWTADDVLAQLSVNPRWKRWKRPAIDEQGNPLWPEARDIEWLMAKKEDVGDMAFALQYMLEGIQPMKELWTNEIINKCKDKDTIFGHVPANFEIDGISIGLDPAASLKQDGSYSCVFVLLYDKYHRKCPYRIIRKRTHPREIADDVVDLICEIESTLTRRVDIVTVENNATQQAFVDLINLVCENRGISLKVPIVGATTTGKKWGPEMGLPRMAGEFEAGKWIIPYRGNYHFKDDGREWKDPLHTCNICSWINEMLKYGSAESTTDMIMGSWLASAAIDKQIIGDLAVTVRTRRVNVGNVNWG